MCGRFTLRTPADRVTELFPGLEIPLYGPRYNIAPTQPVCAVRQIGPVRQWTELRWGLIPFWAKDKKIGARLINARSETVDQKPSFRAAFKKRRCLIPADGFFEWKRGASPKTPFYFTLCDESPFCLAGLWERWETPNELIESCTLLTTEANALVAGIHDRMPVILGPDDYDVWLDPGVSSADRLRPLLTPWPADAMKSRQVSTCVNRPLNDGPECIAAIGSSET